MADINKVETVSPQKQRGSANKERKKKSSRCPNGNASWDEKGIK